MMLNSARRCFKSLIQPSIVEKHRRFCIIYRNILNLNGVAKYNLSSRISNFRCQRGVSTVNSTAANTITLKDESREFMAVFPDVVRDLTDAGRHTDIPEANKWFAKVLQYNVPSGRKIRGLALIYAYKQLVPADHLTPDNLRLAYIMAWCIEMLQAFFLLEDDIMDSGEERRGKPCWYRHNNLGLAAINDGLLLESSVYLLLRRHFRDKPFYLDAVEAFLQITHKTFLGQSLDIHSFHKDGRPRLEHYTMDRYNSLVKYKTAYYSFCLPVVLAMHMAGYKDPEMFRQAQTILLEMGHFFQVQDDFLDCFGNNETTGKSGAGDISNGKCTWLAVVALQRVSSAQRAVFEECFGHNDPDKEATIKRLYEELGLRATFAIYEEETYNRISTHIQQMSRGLPHRIFFKFLDRIYRRER